MKIHSSKLLKGDSYIIAFILILALVIYILTLPKTYENNFVEVYLDGELVYREELEVGIKEYIEIDETVQNTIEIDGLQVRIIEATCQDHVCENTGYISKAGEVIVCLPNKLLIKIVGEELENEFDAVVG